MKIISEKPSDEIIMEFDLSKDEFEILIKHANENMPESVKNELFIEWAIIDTIKNNLKDLENE